MVLEASFYFGPLKILKIKCGVTFAPLPYNKASLFVLSQSYDWW